MNDQYYSPQKFSILPLMVKNIMIINGLFFVATIGLNNAMGIDMYRWCGLYYFDSPFFKPYQILTYLFMHGNFGHLFFNMFALWMFGSVIENYWGGKRFLIYYFITGMGAAAFQLLIHYFQLRNAVAQIDADMLNQMYELLEQGKYYNVSSGAIHTWNNIMSTPMVGASGSVFGLLLAFGMMFPNQKIYLYFLFPIKAKWFVIGYGLLELIYGVTGSQDGVAHFAHLGGMLFGLLLILLWRKRNRNKNEFYY